MLFNVSLFSKDWVLYNGTDDHRPVKIALIMAIASHVGVYCSGVSCRSCSGSVFVQTAILLESITQVNVSCINERLMHKISRLDLGRETGATFDWHSVSKS